MALDPTTPTSWGLGPLGAPSASTAPFANLGPSPMFTPAQIAQMRQEASALQQPPEGGIHHWTQGLAELVRAIQGNREADFARQAEAQGRQQGAQAISSLYAPYLQGGGAGSMAPAGPRGSDSLGATSVSSNDQPDSSDPRGMEPYIRETAAKYGVDPDTAVKVARSEGLQTFLGDNGKSGGAFQLYTGGGMGNDFQKETGLDPLDPKNEKATIDYALSKVPKTGWAPFHGAARVGIGPRYGINADAGTSTGLLAPIPDRATPNQSVAQNQAPVRLAYAGDTLPPSILPNVITQGASLPAAGPKPTVFDTGAAPVSNLQAYLSPMVSAIAGRQMPAPPAAPATSGAPIAPADFARAAATMQAANEAPPVPLPSTPLPGVAPAAAPPISPADFAKAAAAMEASKDTTAAPLPSAPISASPEPTTVPTAAAASPMTSARAIPPADFARMANAMVAANSGPSVPLPSTPIPGPAPTSASAPSAPPSPQVVQTASPIASPVPLPQPRPMTADLGNFKWVPAPGGGLMPMAVPNQPPAMPAMISAIAGSGNGAGPAAGAGAPNPTAPIQVAQNGPPLGGPPRGAGGPSGLPQPLTSPVGQINQQQLTQMLANPWVPDSAKAAMLQMIQQRGQPQTMPVEGGTLMFNAAGQKVFIPEPKFGTVKIGGAEIPTVSHFDPATGRWNTTTLAPGGGVQTTPQAANQPSGPLPHPAQAQPTEPDLSTVGGIQAAEAAQAGAKKAAEAGGEASAKYYDSLHKGLAGSAMIAAQQKQNIDMLRQVAATPDFTPGAGSEAALGLQRLAAQFGINPEGAAPREIFNQVATRILADQISGIKSMASETGETGGRIFKSMLDLEEKANITPEDTPAGINAKLNLIDAAGNLMMKWGNMADDYVAEHGKLDPGFDKQLRKEISEARIPNIVPRSEERKPAGEPSVPISGPQTGPTTADTIRQNGVLFKRQSDGSYQAVQ